MKTNKFLIAALAAGTIFASCSKNEEGTGKPGDSAETASINVRFNLSTRAFDAVDAEEGQDRVNIKDVNIFLFNGDQSLAEARYSDDLTLATSTGEQFTDAPGTEPENATITAAIQKIVIVGNAGQSLTAGIANESDLNSVIRSLAQVQTAYAEGATPGAIWVYGEAGIPSWTAPVVEGGPSTASVSVTEINPVVARIDLKVTLDPTTAYGYVGGLKSIGGDPIGADVTTAKTSKQSFIDIEGAGIVYSAAYMNFTTPFAPTLAEIAAVSSTAAPLMSGIIPSAADEDAGWESLPGRPAHDLLTVVSGKESLLNGSWGGAWNANDNLDATAPANGAKFERSFYPIPTNGVYKDASGTAIHPIAVVYGMKYEWDSTLNEGAGDYNNPIRVYWSIPFNGNITDTASASVVMDNGQRYAVNVTLTGDLAQNETVYPDEFKPADVNVTIEQAKWKGVITINQNFDN